MYSLKYIYCYKYSYPVLFMYIYLRRISTNIVKYSTNYNYYILTVVAYVVIATHTRMY